MALLDRLTSSDAKNDAKSVRSIVRNQLNTSNRALFTAISEKLDTLRYPDLTATTLRRCSYDLSRIVQKRNRIYQEVKVIDDNIQTASGFFKQFANKDRQLVKDIQRIQSVMFSLQDLYLKKKYRSKVCTFIERALASETANELDTKELIEDYRDFFFPEQS